MVNGMADNVRFSPFANVAVPSRVTLSPSLAVRLSVVCHNMFICSPKASPVAVPMAARHITANGSARRLFRGVDICNSPPFGFAARSYHGWLPHTTRKLSGG